MKIAKILQGLETFFLNTILPKRCLSCNQEGTFLCKECFKKIELNSFQVCPICQKSLTKYGEVCRYCKKFYPEIDSLTIATDYQNPLVKNLIKKFKYNFIEELSSPLSGILIKTFRKNKLPIPDLIIPVPLHPLRLRWRGFNQSKILAKDIGNNLLPNLKIKLDTKILKRNRFTNTQAYLKNFEDRQKNIQNAFSINKEICPNSISGKRVLIIDDICTTGSTLFECAKQLRQLKPKSIHAIVIARQK